jgi:glycosyltransferase involved in cell wall biosynthesis
MSHGCPESPLVSVVIPVYRASREIPDALASVFAQSAADFVVIVVDDGSPDEHALREAIAPFRERIRFIAQANRGAGAARNTAIAAARGRYLAFLDADDRWSPAFLERQLEYFERHPDHELVYCDARLTGETALAGRRFMEGAPSTGDVTLLTLIQQQCNVPMSTVMVRRGVVVSAGLFDESIRRGQDFDLWLRLAARGTRMGYHAEVLAERRVCAGGLSGDGVTQLQRAINVLDRFKQRHTLTAAASTALRIRIMTLVDRLEIEQARLRFIEGNFAAAQYHLECARQRSVKMAVARLAVTIAPALTRALYVRLRRSTPLNPRSAPAAAI